MRREKHATHFRTYLTTALMIAGAASAQNPPAQSGPNNNAINSDQKNSDKPVAGRNSFTEGQAKSKIEDAGYSNVGELKKDDNGDLARQGEQGWFGHQRQR